MRARYRPCNVVNPSCTAPPAHADSYTATTCYRCGHNVCRRCSRIVPYLLHRRRRLCDHCRGELARVGA